MTHHDGGTYVTRSAQLSSDHHSSKPFSRSATRKFCTVTHGGDRGDRRGAVAARATKAERQSPNIMAVPSSSIHPLPSLARGPTGKAVLALEVRTRTLHGHAPWTRSGAPRWHRWPTLMCLLCLERSCGCRASSFEYSHSSQPIGAAGLRRGSSGVKSKQSCVGQACNKPPQEETGMSKTNARN